MRSPQRELKLQAIRIGELGIAAIPNEVFALTGLKIKARSPLPLTMNIELANGSEGYIPPPEQHVLGGYTTWPARTAALEVQAEPKIVEAVLGLLEQVAGSGAARSHRARQPYAEHVLAAAAAGLLAARRDGGSQALDATGREHELRYRGRRSPSTCRGPICRACERWSDISRAVHLAGGRLVSGPMVPAESYTVELWFWNGLPNDARPVTGYLFARSCAGKPAEALGLGGSSGAAGRLSCLLAVRPRVSAARPRSSPKTWHHLVLDAHRRAARCPSRRQPGARDRRRVRPDAGAGLSAH